MYEEKKNIRAVNRVMADCIRQLRGQVKLLTVLLIISCIINMMLAGILAGDYYNKGSAAACLSAEKEGAMVIMTDHVRNKHILQEIGRTSEFEALLTEATITDEDRELMRMFYLKGYNWGLIADTMGYSESCVRKRHKKILKKIIDIM